ncbi:outer membrane protein transport protein [Psychrobacter sp. I-STPA6b]|uniref:outer membrane protein transport protein n=1 Tax=Psychrobacter sp. I-STPA6b TaxID=2585718 RepID=UPI001D0C32CB|nr:outer membrane protein transport protein [Psychrobacter sp. I-STPA6b]
MKSRLSVYLLVTLPVCSAFAEDKVTDIEVAPLTNIFAPLYHDATQVQWSITANAYSPTQSIHSFVDDWDAPLESGDYAYAQGRAGVEIMPAQSMFSYGLDWRYDYLMKFSESTAQVYHQYKNKQISTHSQVYPLSLQVQHNERLGIHIGTQATLFDDWTLDTKAHLWKGLHSIDGQIYGQLLSRVPTNQPSASSKDSVDKAVARLDYYYDKPALGEENLNWHPATPQGYGYSFDISLQGQLTDNTQLNIQAYDVLGHMYWKDIASTNYDLEYGVNRRPVYTIEGKLLTKDVRQHLPWQVEASLTHQLDNQWQLGLQTQSNEYSTLYQLSAGYPFQLDSTPVVVTGIVEPQTQAFGVEVDSAYGGVKFLADSLNSHSAKRAEISLYGRYHW